MSIPSHQLEAFLALARQRSFSKAAKTLHITQSALSQRIAALEDTLEHTLFLRDRAGATPTAFGEELLRFAQAREMMEEEALRDILGNRDGKLSGSLRIGVYSSIARSVVLPSLSGLLRQNSGIACELICRPVDELPSLLQRAEADLIVLDRIWDHPRIAHCVLGQEKYVFIEPTAASPETLVMLDNDPGDRATEIFFAHQEKKAPSYRRAYFHDCYGILDAVSSGLGAAVMPQHMLKGVKGLRVKRGFKPVSFPVTLHFYQQAFTTKLQKTVVSTLEANCPKFLSII